ncbi:bcl-2-like protein 12 isoform X2 [Hyla sarda]|nr:bcl-2-like protein 12 isoform X2 [Hyla sarda]XP_056399944.1 bcl-2-like protein 12 isoform X2 [Hyla sarda]XP_056399945.1 bcl-2-like protein 12 isoform X2 [Hyla sarda]XP_056399946.1 bcl-2-like protein 12 isoform X2 [Hyla sarda]XP_056399947.1 bcl-2-like protein 12 isoform X2 [Hyla sarda]XP_056399948.1 bcl-2-like protein 12 isoform X2 [Hyla sarda]
MDIDANPTNGDLSLIKVKAETKCVLEAFLKRSLSQEEGRHLGHVGRSYHDPKKYSHRGSHEDGKESFQKKTKKSDRKKNKESEKDEKNRSPRFGERSAEGHNGTWNSLHEEINRVEETKHGFKTNIKKLLRKNSQSKEKAVTPKEKNGSINSKSRDSIDSILNDHEKGVAKADSLKRPKSPNPLLACTLAPSTISLEETGSHEKHKKAGRSFSLKRLLKKKTHKDHSVGSDSNPPRPDFLPLTPCYDDPRTPTQETGKLEDSEVYSLAAKKLETLIKHKKLKSPQEPPKIPAAPSFFLAPPENNNVVTEEKPTAEDKDEIIRKLVALLQEQAEDINKKISKDPFLRNSLSRLSYGSFFRLAEVFTSNVEVEKSEAGSSVSPELTKIALTMELTRKVAGINSHAIHTLMGYSLQYMDMFVPWLQQQGGWEKIVSHEDVTDMQID